jgi:hypothetical protein
VTGQCLSGIGSWSNDTSAALGHPGHQSNLTHLVKYEWPDIAIFYAKAHLANDVRLAPGQLVTPDFAAHDRRLLAALGQPHKIHDSEPALCSRSRRPRADCALTTAA